MPEDAPCRTIPPATIVPDVVAPGLSSGDDTPGAVRIVPLELIRASYAPLRPGNLQAKPPQMADLPIRVIPTDDEHYEILDGHKRFVRWRDAGYQSIPAIIETPVGSSQRKRLLLLANAPHRTLTALDEALVVESLITDDGLTQQGVAQLLGRKPHWVARRLLLATQLSAKAQDELARGQIGPSFAYALTALSPEDQEDVLRVSQEKRLKARDAILFAQAYRVADSTDRKALLRDPVGTLRPDPTPIRSPRAAQLEGRLNEYKNLLADLRTFSLPADLPPPERRRLDALWKSLCQDLADTALNLLPASPEDHPLKNQEFHDALDPEEGRSPERAPRHDEEAGPEAFNEQPAEKIGFIRNPTADPPSPQLGLRDAQDQWQGQRIAQDRSSRTQGGRTLFQDDQLEGQQTLPFPGNDRKESPPGPQGHTDPS